MNVVTEIGKYMDITVLDVIGGTNVNECRMALDKQPQIIVGTPGRILDMINRKSLFR